MPDFSTTDPYTQVLDALWGTLEAWAPFAAAVKAGNRIKLDRHEKTARQDADFPQVRIEPSSGNVQFNATSSGHMLTQAYAIEVNTGSRLPRASALPVKWAVVQAMAAGQDAANAFDALPWVVDLRLDDTAEGDDTATEDETRPGWTVVLSVTVRMHIDNASMAAGG